MKKLHIGKKVTRGITAQRAQQDSNLRVKITVDFWSTPVTAWVWALVPTRRISPHPPMEGTEPSANSSMCSSPRKSSFPNQYRWWCARKDANTLLEKKGQFWRVLSCQVLFEDLVENNEACVVCDLPTNLKFAFIFWERWRESLEGHMHSWVTPVSPLLRSLWGCRKVYFILVWLASFKWGWSSNSEITWRVMIDDDSW